MTEPGSFLGQAFAKLARAEHHAGDLQREVDTWIATRSKTPLAFSAEFQAEQNRFAYRVAPFRRDLPLSWPLIIGDALTNLRAALDSAAWQLVARRSDATPISMFPARIAVYVFEHQQTLAGEGRPRELFREESA